MEDLGRKWGGKGGGGSLGAKCSIACSINCDIIFLSGVSDVGSSEGDG